MTSVLAPQGVGLWGQNLRFTGAVGVAPTIPSDAYNRNSIGQRGGTVITPIADVTGVSRSNASSDPFNKQAAALIIRDEPKPRTLRDGFVGGEASFERGGIVTPIARVALTKDEVTARLASEGKSERPVSAKPMSLNDAIAILKTAEETWPSVTEGMSEAETNALEEGYTDLVSDAKRLKIIKGATMRRPITDEEQGIVNQIANKYASALGGEASEVVAAERAVVAEEARPANEAASLAAAEAEVAQELKNAEDDITLGENAMLSEIDRVDDLDNYLRDLDRDYDELMNQRDIAIAGKNTRRIIKILENVRELEEQGRTIIADKRKSQRKQTEIGNDIATAEMARDAIGARLDDLSNVTIVPSRGAFLRAESTARFAPHDRERQRQAEMMRSVMVPEFQASRELAGEIATDAYYQREAALRQAEDTREFLEDRFLSTREDIAEGMELARVNQADTEFELGEIRESGQKRGAEAAAREGRMANRYAQEQKTMREEIIEPTTQMGSRLGAIENDVGLMRKGLETVASSLVSTKENPVTIIIQSGSKGRRGESMKEVMLEEFTQPGGGFQTTTLADLRRG